MLKSLLSRWFLQSPEVALQLEITSAGSQCLALTCWHSRVVLLNCEGGSAVLRNSRNSPAVLPEDEIIFSLAVGTNWILQTFHVSRFSVWLKLWNIVTQLSASYILLGSGGIERMLNMTSYVSSERRHAQCGVIMVRDSEAVVEMWVEQRGRHAYKSSLLSSTSITITCHILNIAIPHFHRTGNSTPEI